MKIEISQTILKNLPLFMTQILDQDIFNVKVNKLENVLVE